MTPVFLNAEEATSEAKIDFNLSVTLTCTESWVSHPKFHEMLYRPKEFGVQVDPRGLPAGVHSAYIRGYDSKNVSCSIFAPRFKSKG